MRILHIGQTGKVLVAGFCGTATPEYIKTYVDGKQLFYYNPEDYSQGRNANTWPFDKPFELKLNLAWGGDWGGMYGVDESCLPATYEIDYVRVFQK